MQRRVQPVSCLNDFLFTEVNDRRFNPDSRFRFGPCFNEAIEGFKEFRPAIGVATGVFGHGANKYFPGSHGLRPTCGHAEDVGIAERNIRGGYVIGFQIRFGYREGGIR